MDEEELFRQSREVGRNLISDAEFNKILSDLTDAVFSYSIENNPAEMGTVVYCYNDRDASGARKVTRINVVGSLDTDSMNNLGKKMFDMGLSPVAVFMAGFGDFFIARDGVDGAVKKGVIVGGTTVDDRSGHAHVELTQGEKRLIPVGSMVFPFDEKDTRNRHSALTAVFDGYAELMKVNEVVARLSMGLMDVGLWNGGHRPDG